MKKISFIGILSGFILSIIVFILLNLVMVLFFKHIMLNGRMDLIPTWYSLLFYVLVAISISSALGGFIATKISKRNSYLNPLIVGLFLIIYFLLLGVTNFDHEPDNMFPTWVGIAGYLIMIPSSLFGGYLHLRSQK